MKLHLTRATVIDPIANLSSEQHILHIFVNRATDYPAAVSILQKGIDAITSLLKADPNTLKHRIDVVLDTSVAKGEDIKPVDVVLKAKILEEEKNLKPKEKKGIFKRKPAKDAEEEIDNLFEDEAIIAANAALEAEIERKRKELDLLREKANLKKKE
jgi:hypothetical protein